MLSLANPNPQPLNLPAMIESCKLILAEQRKQQKEFLSTFFAVSKNPPTEIWVPADEAAGLKKALENYFKQNHET
jgi:hypothetical protein